jgi:ABC-type lipoprotein release transport system permease subunit
LVLVPVVTVVLVIAATSLPARIASRAPVVDVLRAD